ncbi:MAG: DUF2298 domain-containing protein [Nanoarchaeota archaeon]|nr:DUF2298 domain-containing protein [Nanoarchaeota archaeon]
MFNIIFIIFKLIVFWFILFFFGYQTAKRLSGEEKKENLIALSGLIGVSLYVFFINAIGHFMPIQTTFYLVLSIFFLVGVILFLKNKSKILRWEIEKKWRRILLITILLLIVTTFIVDNRYPLGGDQVLLGCMPTAATIAEGNFPPKAIWIPPYPLRYHYGPHLFAAAIYKTTGLPLYISYDIQVAILVGVLFLLGFVFIKKLIKDDKKSFISSILMLCAGSSIFLKGLKGIPILYNKYILHQDIFAPFKFVFEMVEGLFSRPAFQWMINFSANALSFVLMIGIIYLYFSSIKQGNKKIVILNALLLSVLALFAETFFVVFCFLLVVYPFIFGLVKKDWLMAKKFLIISLLMLIIAIPIAFIQGDTLTLYLDRGDSSMKVLTSYTFVEKYEINKTPWILMTRIGKDNKLPIYSFEFLLQWGLLLLLIVVASIYFWKRYSEFILFLITSFFVFFLIPFFVIFPAILGATERFFYPANLFGGLIIGLFLADIYFKERNSGKRLFKKIIIFVIVALIAQGIIFQLIFLTIGYPPGKWNNADEFFIRKDSFEGTAYQWVKENTKINDYFLILNPNDDYGLGPNLKFIFNTGRLAPIYTYLVDYKPIDLAQSYAFKRFKENCDSELMKYLNYKYLFVDANWPIGLEEKCLVNNNLELKFDAKKGDKFIRIYEVK